LSRRALLAILIAGVLGAALFGIVGLSATAVVEKRYRAEMELALTPGPQAVPELISDYWEALSRGQASRIAAEVLNHRRWREPAAGAAGLRPEKISVTSGVIADTSLITVGVEAPSAEAAETAVESLVREAAPTAEQISGPFTLQVVQPAAGGAVLVSMPRWQTLGIYVLAGGMVGVGSMLLVQRRRLRRCATVSATMPPGNSRAGGEPERDEVHMPANAGSAGAEQPLPQSLHPDSTTRLAAAPGPAVIGAGQSPNGLPAGKSASEPMPPSTS
jgi:hypothetical protein